MADFPTEILAGDSYTWEESYSDYPSSDYTLKFALKGLGALVVTAAPSGSDYAVTLTATQTSTLPAGMYEYASQVTSGSMAYTVASGRLQVKPNLITAAAGSRQAHAERMKAAIEAVLEGRVTADVVATTIAGVSVTKIPIPELTKLRASYARELYKMKHGKGTIGRPVYITFGPVE